MTLKEIYAKFFHKIQDNMNLGVNACSSISEWRCDEDGCRLFYGETDCNVINKSKFKEFCDKHPELLL